MCKLCFLFRQHEDRVAIPDVKLRQDFKKWTEGKLNKPSTNKLKAEMRKKCIVIFNVMKWSIDVFLEVNLFPRSLRNVLQLLSSVSPVCSYFEPSEEAIALALKMLEPNVKADSEVMKSIQLQFPLFHDLLSSLTIEASLPDIWKGVILYLSDKACQPFNVANIINTPNCDSTNEIGR